MAFVPSVFYEVVHKSTEVKWLRHKSQFVQWLIFLFGGCVSHTHPHTHIQSFKEYKGLTIISLEILVSKGKTFTVSWASLGNAKGCSHDSWCITLASAIDLDAASTASNVDWKEVLATGLILLIRA